MSALADYPAVLTVEEAAGVLRIGRSAAYAAAKAGELPTIRLGRILRVPRHQLAQLLGEPLNDHDPVGSRVAGKEGAGVARPPG